MNGRLLWGQCRRRIVRWYYALLDFLGGKDEVKFR